MAKRVLIIEDDRDLAQVVTDNLEYDGFQVESAHDGDAGLARIRAFGPDLVLLDVMLPGRGGFEICAILRETIKVPVVILSARGLKADKLKGLGLGADDYITKPFDIDELVARVKAVLRRVCPTIEYLRLGSVDIDFNTLRATIDHVDLHLTHREFEVLRYLAERAERVVHRDELLRELWGYVYAPATRAVDHAITRLRRKIEPEPHRPQFIHTVHGDGYRLTRSPRIAGVDPERQSGSTHARSSRTQPT